MLVFAKIPESETKFQLFQSNFNQLFLIHIYFLNSNLFMFIHNCFNCFFFLFLRRKIWDKVNVCNEIQLSAAFWVSKAVKEQHLCIKVSSGLPDCVQGQKGFWVFELIKASHTQMSLSETCRGHNPPYWQHFYTYFIVIWLKGSMFCC